MVGDGGRSRLGHVAIAKSVGVDPEEVLWEVDVVYEGKLGGCLLLEEIMRLEIVPYPTLVHENWRRLSAPPPEEGDPLLVNLVPGVVVKLLWVGHLFTCCVRWSRNK